MKKISFLSNLLMFSFILYIFWIIFSFLYSWVVLKYPINSPIGLNLGSAIVEQHSSSLPDFFTMDAPLMWKIACLLETIIIFSFYLFFAGNAVRLFGLFRSNIIFDLKCVALIKRIGFALLLINVSHLICPAINTYILSNQLRNIPKALFLGTDQITLLIVSLSLIAVSWIMEEGYKLHDELLHTV